MKRVLVVFLVVCVLGFVSRCAAQTTLGLGKKADVLVELQQIPLESFGVPADVPNADQWSTWLVRLTNRCKQPIMVTNDTRMESAASAEVVVGPASRSPRGGRPAVRPPSRSDFPPPLGGGPVTRPLAPGSEISELRYYYSNWVLLDGEDKRVGKVLHEVVTHIDESGVLHSKPVFDYLLVGDVAPLGDPQYALHAPPRRLTIDERQGLSLIFEIGFKAAGSIISQLRRRTGIPSPPIAKPAIPEGPCNALWPGKTVWGYLVFYRGIATRSQKVLPKGYFGKGVSWARVVNPKLASELTRPHEEGAEEASPTQKDAIQRWLREHGYATENGEK